MKKFLFGLSVLVLYGCEEPKRFELLSVDETGIDFKNELIEKDSFNILHNEYMYNGGGVGVADFNRDGLADLVFTGNKVSTRVYLNKGDFKFEDITPSFEGLTNDQWYSGVNIVDINADGWQDVYLTSTSSDDRDKRVNRLWINSGKDSPLAFKEMSGPLSVNDKNYSVHSGFFDYDLDGDLDLFILNNIVNKNIPTNYRPKINDGTAVNNDKLYRNDGGKFTDVTIEAGIVHEGYGLGLAFGDINKDGYPDMYVSNDYISNDILYLNNTDGTFRDATADYLSHQSRFSMGNEMVDVNNDGNLDIMSVDMMPEVYSRKKQTINGNSYLVYVNNEKYKYEPQFVRNMLHLHNGFKEGKMLPFSEVGQMMGIFQTEWSWAPLFADYDNDGDRDLLLTNGFPKDLTDKDFTNYKAQVYGFVADDEHMINRIPVVKVPNYAFENTGPYAFKDKTEEWGLKTPSFSNGAAFVDLDNDGDLDYVVNNINDPAFVYRNNSIGKLEEKNNFLKIALSGSAGNPMAIGCKIEVWTNGRKQYYEHFLTRGYISSVDPTIHFGLGNYQKIDSLTVIWPRGTTITRLKDIKANQLLTLAESDAKEFSRTNTAQVSKGSYIFDQQRGVLEFAHRETDYIDFFQNQRILQHKLSQIGPCMAKGDLNGDGRDDLLVGGSAEAETAVFVNRGGTFQKAAIPGLSSLKNCSESDMAILDVDKDGDNDVVSVSGSYENDDERAYRHYLFRNNGKEFVKEDLATPAFIASVVRPYDFDHDGDTDLFIGARVKRSMYPNSPASYILKNNGGQFSDTLSVELGMVTDAVWSDYDKDGWEDLVVSREWNSIAILKNNGSKLSLIEDKALAGKRGFWSSIIAADLDQDGDDDYIAGNLGMNHRFVVSDEFPMRLYAMDIDNNGFIDPLTTSYWKNYKGEMTEFPVNYLDELVSQSPIFRKKFTNYTKFSYTPVDSIIDKSAITPNNVYAVNTTLSYVIWNEGGTFKYEALPDAAQIAPIKKTLVKDLNGDATSDVVLTGNDYTYDVSTGYYNASKGLVLINRKNRSFDVLLPSQSGLAVEGQVTSLLYFEGSPCMLVVGVNRDSVAVFEHRTTAKTGL
jgi:enediyne biosynthesis protein E4